MPDPSPDAPSPRAALTEVTVGTALAGLGIGLVELGAAAVPALGPWSGALVAAVFLGLPLLIARRRGFAGDPLGIGRAPLVRGALWGLAATAVVAAPFALGYDVLATQVWQQTRFAGPGLLSPGLEVQGYPSGARARVLVYEDGHHIAFENRTADPVQVQPAEGPTRTVPPGSRVRLQGRALRAVTVASATGRPLPPAALALGAAAQEPPPGPLSLARERWWLLWLLLTHLVVVALPEEAFFRGWVLGRLRQALPAPKRRVLGVPFGRAHVISAALFAAVHLVVTPAPHRLLVFFPGLLFAWLAERSGAVIAPTVHHALSNVLLRVVSRLYR